jgi:4-amino-4-deoxy-L-arabinose transferase-like glycosyltransferase
MRTIIILCLAYVLFVHNLGNIALWDPDEPRQAIMAREMIDRGDYIHPHLNGLPYLEKPPLYPWLIILTAKITGTVNEFSSRLPSALAATLLLLLTYFVGRRTDDEAAGFLSALVLATNYQFLGNARESVMDMTFAACMGLAIVLGYLCVEKKKHWFLPFALLPAAAAILAKGPAGLVIPVSVLFLYGLASRQLRATILPLFVGSLVSIGIASIWFFLAGTEYAGEFILRQNIARYTTGFDHIEPFYYYFHKLFFNFLPWSLVLPFAVYHSYKRKLWLPLIWLLFTFLFFEASRSKRAIYLLSLYPAAALVVAIYLKDKWYVLLDKRWTHALLSAFGLLITVLPLLIFPAMYYFPDLGQMFAKETTFLTLSVCALALTGLGFFFTILKRMPDKNFFLLFTYLIFAGYIYHSLYMPAMDRAHKSVRLLTDELQGMEKSSAIYTYGFNSAALIFYVGKPIGILRSPNDIPQQKDDIIVIVEDKRNNIEGFKELLPLLKRATYDKDNYAIFVRKHER